MKAIVDKDICIGCAACTGICPEVFDMDNDGLAVAIESEIEANLEDSANEACESCPVCAISINK